MKRAFGHQQIIVGVAGILLLAVSATVRWLSLGDPATAPSPPSTTAVVYPNWETGQAATPIATSLTPAGSAARERPPSPAEVLADTRRHPKERIAALPQIVAAGDAETLAQVIEAEPNFPTRHLLIKALGDTKNADAVPILVRIAAGDPAVESRRLAVRALENFPKDSAAVEALRAAAKQDPDVYVRKNAVRSLVRMDPPELIDCLYEIKTNERDRGVLAMIDQSLARGAGR